MTNWLNRTELLLGEEKLARLKSAHVLIVGLGGVGAYAAELLCRAGVGELTIVDGDVVEASNRNRQLPALISNEGRAKAEVLSERFKEINPAIKLHVLTEYLEDERLIELLHQEEYSCVVDAIDTLTPKVLLVSHCVWRKLPIVSAMGAGGKLDPMQVKTVDIKKSYNCRLAKQLRKRLHRLGIDSGVVVVFSPEEVDPSCVRLEEGKHKKSTVGTISYMPPLFGCQVAAAAIKQIVSRRIECV